MAKQVFYDDDARKRVLAGAEALYKAVKTTMGPKGRNVVISKAFGPPTVTHDGVTVAKGIDLDEGEGETLGYKVGAELIKQAASRMNDVAGDGTTTVTVLTYHILNEANKLIAAGHNPMLLRKGLEAAAQDVAGALNKMGDDITGNKKKVAEVATISAGDAQIGDLIANVIDKVGKDGVVTVEEGQGLQLESEVVEGFTFDRGFVSPYMVTDTARMEAVYDKPVVIITDKKVTSIQEFLPLLEKLAQAGKKDLVLIADDVDGEAMGTLILNRLKGVFNTLAIKAPAFGDRRKDVLNDIAILTGATVITEDQGMTFETVGLEVVGSARKVIADKDNTTIIEGGGTPAEIAARIKQLNAQIEQATSEYDKENIQKRQATLGSKVAVIKVGGVTETEIEEKKFRVDDAVAAVKAALDEGIVPGGGATYVALSKRIGIPSVVIDKQKGAKTTKTIIPAFTFDADMQVTAGSQVLKQALLEPFKALMLNAGQNEEAKLGELLNSDDGLGFDVNSPEELIPLMDSGIVDPKRVTKEAVQNAVSIAGTAMTMGALVVDEPKDETPAGGAPGMGGMGGMM